MLGELEARVLEVVWSLERPTVKDVTDVLGPGAHVKTIMTVMNRMVDKGLLRRERSGRAFVYEAAADRETFTARVASKVIAGLLADFRAPALAHLVETADPAQLTELDRLIRSRRDG